MNDVKLRLDAWRNAERRRDGLDAASTEWRGADDEVRTANKAFHAELAQASARYTVAELRGPQPGWFTRLDRLTQVAAD